MLITGNKGEWSEIYVLFKILGQGKLYAADEKLNKIDDIFYDIIKILRKENIETIEYRFIEKLKEIKIINSDKNTLIINLPAKKFEYEAEKMFIQIKTHKKKTFSLPETQEFMEQIYINKLKAPSADKTDIRIQIHDLNTGYEPELGFSIKSRLGKPSTLLNPGPSTNFTYRIIGDINETEQQNFNNNDSNTLKDKLNIFLNKGYQIEFIEVENKKFNNNLVLIDSKLSEIMAYLLLEYYINGYVNIKEAIESLNKKNPLKYDLEYNHNFYSYKVKHFISEVALGMTPATIWDGNADVTGGYIIVREDGEVLCYHLYNRNEFENYLLNNTKFEMASRGRYNFGKIYKENNEYKIKLNLQIRFIK
jgi:hypothetical protein